MMELLMIRLEKSREFQLDCAEFTTCAPYENPDYISLCLKDYNFWSGFNEALYCGHFKQETEKWNNYYIPNGDIPNIRSMQNLKGIIISGAIYNMTDTNLPWMADFIDVIRQAYQKQGVKILGICLGHQAVAHALGGKIGRNPDGRYVYQFEHVRTKNDNFLGNFKVAQLHRECVLQVPSELSVMHSSDTCKYESMYRKGKVFTLQGHPEYSAHFTDHAFGMDLDGLSIQETESERHKVIASLNTFLRSRIIQVLNAEYFHLQLGGRHLLS